MILARGTRFMRAKSARFRGRASGSLSAAAMIPRLAIRPFVRLRVDGLLMSRCPSGRNNPNAVITLGVGDEQKNSLGEPELYESLLAIVLTIVEYRNCE